LEKLKPVFLENADAGETGGWKPRDDFLTFNSNKVNNGGSFE
jgi:hypothetical protein